MKKSANSCHHKCSLKVHADCTLRQRPEKSLAVSLLFALAALSLLPGAAFHTDSSVLATGAAAIAAWLLAFGARERLARRKQH